MSITQDYTCRTAPTIKFNSSISSVHSNAVDILRRYKQFIFILRDTFSSYTQLIPNERHDTIREAIILGISHFRPSNQTSVIIRVDSASGNYALRDDFMLKHLSISLDFG